MAHSTHTPVIVLLTALAKNAISHRLHQDEVKALPHASQKNNNSNLFIRISITISLTIDSIDTKHTCVSI